MKNVAIIGGGLAGLISSILLAEKGVPCILFEKKNYPFHRVCGEYISNETVQFLKLHDLYPKDFFPSQISELQLSAVSGYSATMPLDLGGFAISRYTFDHFLYQKARELGVEFRLEAEVLDVVFSGERFKLKTLQHEYEFDLVIGAYGKRAKLDLKLARAFTKKRSPYVGVKYHVKCDHPANVVALHNFHGGYCGVVNVENGLTNLCYLVHRDVVKKFKNLEEMEKDVLSKNPFLNHLFSSADFADKKPVVINEISFETKGPVEGHMLTAGDAAGMITPLCGNGMAMAIHAGKLAGNVSADFCKGEISRNELEHAYKKMWTKNFAARLRMGRAVQRLFGNAITSNIAVNLVLYIKPLSRAIVKNTHGEIF